MWFSKSKEEVLKEFNVDPLHGLSEEEVSARFIKYGFNQLQGKKKKSIFLMFIEQLKNWLIYILLLAVIITIFLGEYTDAIIILLVIIINSVLGVIQQVKAGKAIEALQIMLGYVNRIGITIAKNSWSGFENDTIVEAYIEESGLLNERPKLIKMDSFMAEEATESRLIEGIKKIIS